MHDSLTVSSLRGRTDWHGHAVKRALCAAKYLVRSLQVKARHRAWLAFIRDNLPMPAVVARDPRLFERYQHRYINLGFDAATRLALVHGHYEFIIRRWPAALVEAVYVGRAHRIGQLTLRDGSQVDIVLKAPPVKGLEGELGIYLCDTDGTALSSVILTIAHEGRSLLVGCVQGAKASEGKEAVRDLTRQCHGLRPKNLLLSLVYAVAQTYNSERVRGVGQAVHPFAHKQDKIKSDYNGFWHEVGGVAASDGMFDLPAREAVRDAADVDSKHRSAFRRREALRAQAMDMLATALDPGRVLRPEAKVRDDSNILQAHAGHPLDHRVAA
jgi:uncharacterized protein